MLQKIEHPAPVSNRLTNFFQSFDSKYVSNPGATKVSSDNDKAMSCMASATAKIATKTGFWLKLIKSIKQPLELKRSIS